MELTDSNLERSYLSLQPPPGRVIDDDIQFETLDLYLWTGSQFSTPSLLFYAGPVYQEGVDDINAQTEAANSEVKMGALIQCPEHASVKQFTCLTDRCHLCRQAGWENLLVNYSLPICPLSTEIFGTQISGQRSIIRFKNWNFLNRGHH